MAVRLALRLSPKPRSPPRPRPHQQPEFNRTPTPRRHLPAPRANTRSDASTAHALPPLQARDHHTPERLLPHRIPRPRWHPRTNRQQQRGPRQNRAGSPARYARAFSAGKARGADGAVVIIIFFVAITTRFTAKRNITITITTTIITIKTAKTTKINNSSKKITTTTNPTTNPDTTPTILPPPPRRRPRLGLLPLPARRFHRLPRGRGRRAVPVGQSLLLGECRLAPLAATARGRVWERPWGPWGSKSRPKRRRRKGGIMGFGIRGASGGGEGSGWGVV